MNSGIYLIINKNSGKKYVGSTSNIRQRLADHRSRLCGGCHKNPHLQSSWDKYGKGSFIFMIARLTRPKKSELMHWEQYYIDALDPEYNMYPVAEFPGFGENHARAKLSDQDIKDIRNIYKNKEKTRYQLASIYNISISSINAYVLGERRKGSGGPMQRMRWDYIGRGGEKAITDSSAKKARLLYDSGKYSQADLADKFGVSRTLIANIVRGETRKGVGGPTRSRGLMLGEDNPKSKLSDTEVLEIEKIYGSGDYTQKEIADKYGVHRSYISNIANHKRRPHLWGDYE